MVGGAQLLPGPVNTTASMIVLRLLVFGIVKIFVTSPSNYLSPFCLEFPQVL